MTTTRSQIRKMDDVALNYEVREANKRMKAAEAKNDTWAMRICAREIHQLNAEVARREALEAA